LNKPKWPGWRRAVRTLAGSDHSTGSLAKAVALGALVAPTPVFGLHTWMAIGLAFLFRVHRLAAFLGSNIANPLTMPFIVWVDVLVGARVLGYPAPRWPGREALWRELGNLYAQAWVGSLVLGPLLMGAAYVGTAWLLGRVRRRPAQTESPGASPGSGEES
jgi:uncharacterized protein (DUF2062 family)